MATGDSPGSQDFTFYYVVAGTLAAICVGTYVIFARRRKPMAALDPEKWKSFSISEVTTLSHNVRKYRMALPSSRMVLGLPVGQHITIQGQTEEGEEFRRSYTPTTLDTDVGHFDLVIKLYPQGTMSQYLSKLNVGDSISVRGPKGAFKYEPNMFRCLGMIAGGTGITPMYQVARAILESKTDATGINLIFANVTLDDILLKPELDEMAKKFPDRFGVYYVLNDPPKGWQGGSGFVTADLIKWYLPPPSLGIKILRCGPPPMMKAMAAACDSLGYTKEMQFQF